MGGDSSNLGSLCSIGRSPLVRSCGLVRFQNYMGTTTIHMDVRHQNTHGRQVNEWEDTCMYTLMGMESAPWSLDSHFL